jgi:hypothetical protein
MSASFPSIFFPPLQCPLFDLIDLMPYNKQPEAIYSYLNKVYNYMTKEMTGRVEASTERSGNSIDFKESFHDLSKDLSKAYSVSPEIYSQKESISRFENDISVNTAKEFLNHVEYNPDKAEDVIKDFAKTHKPIRFYSGKDTPVNIGVNIGSDELLSLGPDSKANGRSRTIAALAQRAARLESLLSPNGIPEVYTGAQSQTKKALKLVEKAANLAYDWHPGWGVLNTDNALNEAKGQVTRKKVAQGAMVGVMALAGCYMPVTAIPTSTVSREANTPAVTEVVPAITETLAPITEPTQTETAVPTETATPEVVLTLTSEEFLAKTDEELKNLAPVPDIEALGFPEGTELIPDIVIREGEGANFILYKNNATGNIELAWDAETGIHEHAIYSTYEAKIGEEVYKGIPLLILSDPSILDESGGGGWFGLDPAFPDAEEEVGNAFQAALGMYYWTQIVKTGDKRLFEHETPDLSDVPGYRNLENELINVRSVPWIYEQISGPLRDGIADYVRDKFLISLNQKKNSGESIDITLKAKRAVPVDLSKQNIFIIKFICSDEYKKDIINKSRITALESLKSKEISSFSFITQTSAYPVILEIDGLKYDKHNYLYGGKFTGFLRYFFGDYLFSYFSINARRKPPDNSTGYSPDFTTGFATTLCPPDKQPAYILEYYNLWGLPTDTIDYSPSVPYPNQHCIVNFIKKP